MLDTILSLSIILLFVFLLLLIIVENIREYYQPYIDIVPYFDDTKERKALVLWYNEVTNEGVDKKYKVLLKL